MPVMKHLAHTTQLSVKRHNETLPCGNNDTEQEECYMSILYLQLPII